MICRKVWQVIMFYAKKSFHYIFFFLGSDGEGVESSKSPRTLLHILRSLVLPKLRNLDHFPSAGCWHVPHCVPALHWNEGLLFPGTTPQHSDLHRKEIQEEVQCFPAKSLIQTTLKTRRVKHSSRAFLMQPVGAPSQGLTFPHKRTAYGQHVMATLYELECAAIELQTTLEKLHN